MWTLIQPESHSWISLWIGEYECLLWKNWSAFKIRSNRNYISRLKKKKCYISPLILRDSQALQLCVWKWSELDVLSGLGGGVWASQWLPFGVSALTPASCWPSSLTWPLVCRCLVEKGDVAFVEHPTVLQNTDGMCLLPPFCPWEDPSFSGEITPRLGC